MDPAARVLTDAMVAEIRGHLANYPSKQAVTLPALHIVQRELRQVPLQAVVEIAELLELSPAQVQDTLSFYGFFTQQAPHGTTRAWVCRSIACMLRGAEPLMERICERTGLRPGETSADGKLTIEIAECLGACEHAPCVLANETLHKSLTTADVDRLVHEMKGAS